VIKRLIIMLLAVILVIGGIFAWKFHRIMQMAGKGGPPPATIASARVETQTWHSYLHAVGSLVSPQEVYVSNEVEGKVQNIEFDSGAMAKKGQLLARLDDSVDQADLKGLIAAEHLAEVRFQRAARLLKQHSVSQSDYDEAQANLESARANVESKKQVIEQKALRAPFSGLLGIRQVDLGQYLAKGSQIVSLQSLDPIYVDFSLPERYLSALSTGQVVQLSVQAYPGVTFSGSVSAIEPRIDAGTRNVKVRASLSNPDGRLRPGMFADVQVVQPARKDILTLPRTAISYNPYGDMVFVIEHKDGKQIVQSRQVETGDSRDGRVEVVTGLKVGDEVVRAGQIKLRNGEQVVIDNSVKLDQQINTP
jgi:membrane fusion protein (multidrug efflux system)